MEQEEEKMDTEMDASIAVMLKKRAKKKTKVQEKAKERATEDGISPTTRISLFDSSVENHFKAVDTISKLCGEPENPNFDPVEIHRLTSSITFLREWRYFKYPSRTIKFSCQNEIKEAKDVCDQISLPQFSSATVPKIEKGTTEEMSSEYCKDYVMYVGGVVWALDWCPRANLISNSDIRTEFIAVAAHPPDSTYHKVGAPLTGRGVIQIWGLLNENIKRYDSSHLQKQPKKGSSKSKTTKVDSDIPRKPRGRPRKYPVNESGNQIDPNIERKPRGRPRKHRVDESAIVIGSISEEVQPLAIQCLEDSPASRSISVATSNARQHVSEKDSEVYPEVADCTVSVNRSANKTCSDVLQKRKERPRKRPLKQSVNIIDSVTEEQPPAIQCLEDTRTLHSMNTTTANTDKDVYEKDSGFEQRKNAQAPKSALPLIMHDENAKFSSANSQTTVSSGTDLERSKNSVIRSCDTRSARAVPKDISLPRMMLCLAHNGKVAWDLKWRPSNVNDKQRMGYLAVLLGNGALEVWEVPFPRTIKAIYSAREKEDTDPRFIQLEPVFRCSALKCGDRQSIPLTMEWSSSSPHDMILAGCHDGVVALWKFSSTGSLVDTRPLLCFSADTVPIRAISWAPVESYSESANVIVTAGHKGLKFWDIRDPFRPLWDVPLQRIIYSLDWLTDPSCVIASLDDGSIRFLSLLTASNDTPVTGTPFVGTAAKGLHSYSCSSFPIWSIQASRLPGCIAYCTAEGTALHFQLTAKAVEKDPGRYRTPHFLCGSINEEESALTVFTPLRNTPSPMKISLNEWRDTPRSIRGLVTKTNQDKRAKEKMAQDQTSSKLSVLCYGDEAGMEFETDDNMVAQKSKEATKLKTSSKKKSKADELSLVCKEDNPECVRSEGEEVEFPPKIVAMHRVRWNMNQGSENWLCYGGAAGILLCQEINVIRH